MWASGWFSTSDLWFVSPPAHLPYTSAAAQGRSTIPSTGDTARLDSQECAPPAINPPASIAMPIFEAISGGPPTYHAWICTEDETKGQGLIFLNFLYVHGDCAQL